MKIVCGGGGGWWWAVVVIGSGGWVSYCNYSARLWPRFNLVVGQTNEHAVK